MVTPEEEVYTVNETESVTFTCTAVGIPAPDITFFRGNTKLDGTGGDELNARVTLQDQTMPIDYTNSMGEVLMQVSRSITIADTMDSDSGTYTCQASNDGEMTSDDMQDFELVIQGVFIYIFSVAVTHYFICYDKYLPTVAPEITDAPDNLTVVQPQDATFSCNATARPRPNITWWRVEDGSMSQVMAVDGEYIIEEANFGERVRSSTLTIVDAEPNDTGEYACLAQNIVPGDDIEFANLTVHGKLCSNHILCAYLLHLSVLLQLFQTSYSH